LPALGVNPTEYAVNANAKVKTENKLKLLTKYGVAITKPRKKEREMAFGHEISVTDGSSKSYYRKTKKRYYSEKVLMDKTTRNTRVENQTMVMSSSVGEQVTGQLKMLDPEQCKNIMKTISSKEPVYGGSSQLFVHKMMTLNSRMPWGNPKEAWVLGLVDENIKQSEYSKPSDEIVGATPYISNIFNKTYNVKQEIRVELSPGKSHMHNTDIYINEKVYSEMLEYNDNALSKLTHYQVLTASGTPIARENKKTGQEVVTSAKVKLVVTGSSVVHYYWTTDFNHSFTFVDRLPKTVPDQRFNSNKSEDERTFIDPLGGPRLDDNKGFRYP